MISFEPTVEVMVVDNSKYFRRGNKTTILSNLANPTGNIIVLHTCDTYVLHRCGTILPFIMFLKDASSKEDEESMIKDLEFSLLNSDKYFKGTRKKDNVKKITQDAYDYYQGADNFLDLAQSVIYDIPSCTCFEYLKIVTM